MNSSVSRPGYEMVATDAIRDEARPGSAALPVGPPRMDPYSRLLHRFYEPLVLLSVLGKVRGERTAIVRDPGDIQSIRRTFLDDLAFVCDYIKGGSTVTAIGLEERRDAWVYWVAANSNPYPDIVVHLQVILRDLNAYSSLSGDKSQREKAFVQRCLKFARLKIKKEKGILAAEIKKCKAHLKRHGQQDDLNLSTWLDQFSGARRVNPEEICYLAYSLRKSEYTGMLEERSRDEAYHRKEDGPGHPFKKSRHYIGRLAHHIRAPMRLLRYTPLTALKHLLDPTIVLPVPIVACAAFPVADSHTQLDVIAKRMLPTNDARLAQCQDNLTDMDRNYGLQSKVRDVYDNPPEPRIHAEIQILEHFYAKKLRWGSDDRYIACSKPACFCCRLYMRHHPARCVEKESHQKLYLPWGLPELPGGSKDPDFVHQRDILNKMKADMSENAMDQIQKKRGPQGYRPDSTTGITGVPDRDDWRSMHRDTEDAQLSGISEETEFDQDSEPEGGAPL